MSQHFAPSGPLQGKLVVPGDKSISHRAVIFASMAEGTSELSGLLDSADVRSSMRVVESLGAVVDLAPDATGGLSGQVRGWGRSGPQEPGTKLDCGNSGTTARLMLGVLAGWPMRATLVGDDSLSRRPMGRVTGPLTQMGAVFESAQGGSLPITVSGAGLSPIEYASPVASAQVKSAILLAGLSARGRTKVLEPAASRDHTEQMLPAFGIPVQRDEGELSAAVDGPALPVATSLTVPADPSSAAFIAIAALLLPESEVRLAGVSLNATRTGFLQVLERMGARIDIKMISDGVGEPVGDITVTYTPSLRATHVPAAQIPSLIDEVPILALAAARAEGETVFEGVSELKVKESDRLAAIVEGLGELGVAARTDGERLSVTGVGGWGSATLRSRGDHRLAMTWAVAGLASTGGVEVVGFDAVDVSYPSFRSDLRYLTS